jgi:hypothetical protein
MRRSGIKMSWMNNGPFPSMIVCTFGLFARENVYPVKSRMNPIIRIGSP